MIYKPLLNIQMISMIFITILKNTNEKREKFIVFEDMIADMLTNGELNPIVTEVFIRGRN